MEIDFHYYATFTAARLAGFPHEEAGIIAYAAQYVDDSNIKRLVANDVLVEHLLSPSDEYKTLITKFKPIPTCHLDTELGRFETMATWTTSNINAFRRVWSIFHFLPGNYGANSDIRPYTGNKSSTDVVGKIGNMLSDIGINFSGDEDFKTSFNLMCLPNSLLVKDMIDDISTKPVSNLTLYLAGIRMHVLADTWAHCYYSGTPQYWVNDAGYDVYQIDTNKNKTRITWAPTAWGVTKAVSGVNVEESTPNTTCAQSTFYLGHGRMGHIPDYPWIVYEYTPKWSANPIIKDNPSDFIKGFTQMYMALKSIRMGTSFNLKESLEATPDMVGKINRIIQRSAHPSIARDAEARALVWKEELRDLIIDGVHIGIPPDYNQDNWINMAHGNYNDASTHYYRFNLAARMHHDFVIDKLQQAGINLNQGNTGVKDSIKELIEELGSLPTKTLKLFIRVGSDGYDIGKKAVEEVIHFAEDGYSAGKKFIRGITGK